MEPSDVMALLAVIAGIAAALNGSAKKKRKAAPHPSQAPRADAEKADAPDLPPMQGERRHQPAPHVHELQPRVAVTPHTPDMFAGSMNADTGEGFDPCHEEELQPQAEPCTMAPQSAPFAPPAPGLQLSWTGDEMVRAVVMQEILQRPVSRRR